ncbi:hypothetical protein [Pseudomonas hunanensis]|uniref:Y-family DNA polymerase n=1 Tax=Pseudomonas hunanensis TaxID=1247546 RepID=UPI0023E7AB4C|nr:hypothetical protein [Pseudomonas hunanensis]
MSNRVMRTISTLVASIEVYSVDECWCDLTGMPGDLEQLGRDIQARVRQWVNIPVGVGIGPTKTLALSGLLQLPFNASRRLVSNLCK